MSKYPLVIVCILGLLAGGAAALALHHARQGTAEVQGVAVKSEDVRDEAGAGVQAEESQTVENARAEDGELDAGGEAMDEAGGGIAVPAGKAGPRTAGMRVRAEADARADNGSRAGRRYGRASGGQVASGRRGVAGYALGGVKKTGEGVKKTGAAIGKTFGKIGGVFHD